MSDKNKQDHSQIVIDTLDRLTTTQNDIRFLSHILLAWDVNLFPPNANDLAAMSRVCNQIDEQIKECSVSLRSML